MIKLWNEGQNPECTAPVLQLDPISSAALPAFQTGFIFPCPRITNTRYHWCRALNSKATLLHCQHVEDLVLQWGSVRGPVSVQWQTGLEQLSAEQLDRLSSVHCLHAMLSVLKLILCFADIYRWTYIAKPESGCMPLCSPRKGSVQNREFDLNKSLIKKLIYL